MPKRILTMLLLTLALQAAADSVRRLEVFIDTDPGPGNGSIITIAAGVQADTVLSTFSYTLPANLRPGPHSLYVRALADTAGNHPRWSLVQRHDFLVPELVVAAEFFVDTDPGPGAGTPLTTGTPADTVSLTGGISTTGLATGAHVLYVRTKTNTGRWGHAQRRQFSILPAITAAEYFIDTDPGTGNGIALSNPTPADTVAAAWSIATPAGLGAGRHELYMRTRSANGVWSLSQARAFEVLPAINAAEYFFDDDPGPGNGIPMAVAPTSDTVLLNRAISVTGLSSGQHQLYVRSRSTDGRWALSAVRDFYVVPRIVAAECFWDSDPGLGNGKAIAVSNPGDTISIMASIKAPCLTPGLHHVYLRTKDETGRWALSHEDTATFSNPAVVANVSYPGPGPYGTPVKVRGSGGTGPYAYSYNSGAATADSVFLPPNGTSAVFTATDSCGYVATANLSTPASPTLIAGGSGGSGTVDLNGYRHWAWVLDATGRIIAAAKDNGQELGTLSVDYLKNNSGSVRQFPNSSIRYLDRNWLISSTTAPVANVGLQLFAVDSEFNALAAADASLSARTALRVQKYDGPNEDLSPANNTGPGGMVTQIGPDSVISFTAPASAGNGYALAFSASGFSEFYQSRSAAVPLGHAALALELRRGAEGVELSWDSKGVPGLATQQLERGPEPAELSALAQVPVRGSERYTDRRPLPGLSYYRVRGVMQDGRESFSNIVSVRIIGGRMISVYPNPARDYLRIDGLGSGEVAVLYDVAGRKMREAATGAVLDLRALPAGVYMLRIQLADGGTLQQRVEVMR